MKTITITPSVRRWIVRRIENATITLISILGTFALLGAYHG